MQRASLLSTIYAFVVIALLLYKFMASLDYFFLALVPGVFLTYVLLNKRPGGEGPRLEHGWMTVLCWVLSSASLLAYLAFELLGF